MTEMSRQPLLNCISKYLATWVSGEFSWPGQNLAEERRTAKTILDFVGNSPRCFERQNTAGHITGSALVTDPRLERVVLTHHKRLGKWLQLGGHSDGHHLTWEVAMREAWEESGIEGLRHLEVSPWPFSRNALETNAAGDAPQLFDLDTHEIPAHKTEVAHIHYDIRYLIVAPADAVPVISDESHDVRWFELAEARRLTGDPSMNRQFNKLEALRQFAFPRG